MPHDPYEALATLEQGLCPIHHVPFFMVSEEQTDEYGQTFVAIVCSRRGCGISGFLFPRMNPVQFAVSMQHWRAVGGSRA